MEHRIREAKGTILIYKGEPICYNILNTFAEQLGEALQRLGEEVEYFDVKQSGEAALAAYAGKTYQAVIGFQSYLFDIYLPKAGIYLHDLIKGPKINFQFDHPIWMKNHYIRMPEHCYSATHDRNYAAFIEKYYPRIAGSSIIFPGGCEKSAGENGKQEAERNLRGVQDKKEYQISFIGTYTDYRSYLPLIRNSQGIIKKIAAHFLFQMKQHPEETAEKALEESLRKDGIVLSDEEFLEVLDGVKPMIYCIMSYYREKAVKVILEAGITLEVFGDSWKKSPFGDSPYLRIHEAVDMRESLEVMEKSLISFNVMAWHKDGFTERIANSMLQHSVVLTDESTYLKEQFTDGKDILMYRLNELYKIPELLADYLKGAGRDNLQMIAENAYRKAKEDNRREEKEALKVLTEYSPKLLKSMRNVMEELHGNRQPDTDEYLLSIIKGMNWEIQVLNGTMDYLNETEQLIDKQAANNLFVNFSKIYQEKDDAKLAEAFEKEMIPFFEKLEEAAKVRMN